MVTEKNLSQFNQYFPAYADEPPLEMRPLSYLQGRKQHQACHNGLLAGIVFCKINHHIPITPLNGKYPLIHTFIKITRRTRDHEPLQGFIDRKESQQTCQYEQNTFYVPIRFGIAIIARLHARCVWTAAG
jgi:hypothetical protein